MPSKNFNSLEEFESSISNTISPWPKEKRIVLAAAMAERWLPVYEAFSDKNDFGDPATFEDAVQTVWNCVLSHEQLANEDFKLLQERMKKDSPHVDDFDCEEALATIGIVYYALYCCRQSDNTASAAGAMSSALEGVAPVLYDEPEGAADVFRQPNVQSEIEKQFKLIELIGDMAQIDQQSIEALRQKLTSRDLQGPVAPRPKSPSDTTNKAIFERYRKATESDIKNPAWKDDPLKYQASTIGFSVWGRRYLRRKYMIEKLADAPARDALVKKNSTHDAAVQGNPGWDDMSRFMITGSYPHPEAGYDVKSPQHPHSYGPSFRRLCIEGGTAGAWQWSYHVPSSWDDEDRRNEKGLTYTAPELDQLLSRKLSCRPTADVDHPWATEVDGQTWRVRLNDFPDAIMYSLIVEDEVVGDFHDWPKRWDR